MAREYSVFRALVLILLFHYCASPSLFAQDTIRFGVLAYGGEAESSESWNATAVYLNRELPNYCFEITPLTFDKLETAISQKKIDLLICNPASFIQYEEQYGLNQIATLQKIYRGKAYTTYGSVFFTKKENESIQHLRDIKGKKVVAVDCLSTGGFLLPQELLQKNGIYLQEDAKTLIFTHNHDEVVQTVLRGDADLGILRTGIIEEMVEKGEVKLENIKIIHPQSHPDFPFLVSSDLIPEWPLVKLHHFPNELSLEIVRELYDLNKLHADNKAVLNYGWALPSDYSPVSEKLKLIKSAHLEDKGFSFKDSLAGDWRLLLLLLGLTFVFTLFLIFSQYISSQFKKSKTEDRKKDLILNPALSDDSDFYSEKKNFESYAAQKKYELKSYKTLSYFKWLFIVGILYYLSAAFSLTFSLGYGGVSAIWYATGVGFVAVYVFGYRIWPAIFLGALLTYLTSIDIYAMNFDGMKQLFHAVFNAGNNVLEAIIGVYIMRRYSKLKPLFSNIRSTIRFIILPGLLVSLLAATAGSLSFVISTGKWNVFYEMLLTWWLSDLAGLLFVVPLVLSWNKIDLAPSKLQSNFLLLVFTVILTLVGIFVLSIGYHIAYLFLPIFIYFTFRFGRYFGLVMAFILSLVSAWVVIFLDVYWLWNTPEEGLFYVRLFLIILIFSILMVAAILSEQNLAEERMNLYKLVFEKSNEGIAIIDTNGHYREQNLAHQNLVGYSNKELEGKTPAIHLGQDAFNKIAQDLATKGVSVGDWISNTKKGPIPIGLSAFSVRNDENELICHVGIKRDISERKEAENTLKKSEAEAWSLFKYAAIPIMIEDLSAIKIYLDKLKAAGLTDWEAYFDQNPKEIKKLMEMIKIIDVNKPMIDFFGKGGKDELLHNFGGFFNDESLIVLRKEIIALAKGNYAFASEIPIIGLQGEPLHLIINLSIPPLYREKFDRVLVSFVDITENKRAEKIQQILLKISNAANIASDFNETLQVVNTQLGSIVDTSNFFLALYDKEKEELTLPFVQDENDLPKKLPAAKTLTSIVIRDQKPLLIHQEEMEKMEKEGTLIPASKISKVWLGVPLKVKGEVIGAFVVQSFTNKNAYTERDKETLEIIANQIALSIERKGAEENILTALEKAQESDHIKSAFLASMSHELRTPLNAIIGFSNLMDVDLPIENVVMFADMIHKSGNNLLQIVDDIFEVSLIDEGKQEVVYGMHSLEQLMNDIFHTVLTRQKMLNKTGIRIQMSNNWSIQQEVYTDAYKFKNIFLHLLNNALKFTHSGSIHFGLDKIDDDNLYHFYVSDTGIGIPKEKQAFIFDRFRMGDDTHTRQYEGMGIGLFICKKVIEMLNGRIEVHSEENTGSHFSFYLPLHKLNQAI